jgi:hypothetical protein
MEAMVSLESKVPKESMAKLEPRVPLAKREKKVTMDYLV